MAEEKPESSLLGTSLRGWLALILVATVCGMSAAQVPITEPIYTLVVVAVGFYFGQKKT